MAKMSDYIKPHPGPQQQAFDIIGSGKVVFYGGARSGGKAVGLKELVLTDTGWKPACEITFDDKLVAIDGTYTSIKGIFPQVERPMYEIEFQDGQKIQADAEHQWLVKSNKHGKRDGWVIRTTEELAPKKYVLPLLERPAPGNDYSGPNPYWLGYILGNGTLTGTSQVIYTDEDEIVDLLRLEGWHIYRYEYSTCYQAQLNGEEYRSYLGRVSGDAKHIPEELLLANPEVRLALLQGLMDSDGSCDKQGRASFCTTNENLRDGVVYLARSLGGRAAWRRVDKITDRGGRGYYYDVSISYGEKFIPFRLTRKRERCVKQKLSNLGIKSITRITTQDAVCFAVEHPTHLFVVKDFIVTHNSWLALAAAVYVAKKYPGIQIGMMRHTFNELEEVFINKLLANYPDNVWGYKYRDKQHTATFSNKSRIIFRSCETEKDARKAQGVEYQFLVIDEAVNFMPELIQRLLGSCRNAHVKNFKPTVLMTGNPGGMSDQWFIDHYIHPNYDKWEPGELEMKDDYIFIPAKVSDNPSVDKDYVRKLNSLPEHLRRAWLDGDWGVFDGKFFEAWDQEVHVIAERDIPKTWHICAGFDLGYTKQHPTVCLWGAQNPDTGDIIVFDEYVGAGAVETHVRPVAEINAIHGDPLIYADPSMWNKSTKLRESDSCPADMFAMSGVPFLPANNERINGWRMVKSWLNHTVRRPSKLYVTERCTQLITTIGTLRYSKGLGRGEDLDTKMADDAADALRYMIISGFGSPLEYEIEPEARQELRDMRAVAAESQMRNEDAYNDYRAYDFLDDTRVLYTNY